MSDTRTCTMCNFCLRPDYGYSNWTVEGTTLHCLLGLNPALEGREEPWREVTPELAAALDVAKVCGRFRQGAPVALDVDYEYVQGHSFGQPYVAAHFVEYTDDPEAAEALAAWMNNAEA